MPLGRPVLIRGFGTDLGRQDSRQIKRVADAMLVEARRTMIAKAAQIAD